MNIRNHGDTKNSKKRIRRFNTRRFPCPGGCGRSIWKAHARGVFSYQMTQGRCRKCARRENQAALKLAVREKRGTARKVME